MEEKLIAKMLDTRKGDLDRLKNIHVLNDACRRCMIWNSYSLRFCAGIPCTEAWSKQKCFEERRCAKERYKRDMMDIISLLKSIDEEGEND